jgi:drug/metabolite transporter (DMT)-like permease
MNKKITAQIGLLFVTIIWGITFVIVKAALNDAPPFSFAALRFGLATLITLLIVNKNIITITKNEIIGGILCGFLLFLGYAFQNFGLMNTTATKSAFITSVSVLIVPFILVAMDIQKVKLQIWLAVVLATFGLYLLILPGGGINIGDVITFGCAVSFALHIILRDNYLKKEIRLLPFICIQLAFVTLISFIHAQVFEPEAIIWSTRLTYAIIITGIFATLIALLIMVWAQKILNPSETALIFAMEPVAAALFAMVFAGEILGLLGWIGGGFVCLAVVYGKSG